MRLEAIFSDTGAKLALYPVQNSSVITVFERSMTQRSNTQRGAAATILLIDGRIASRPADSFDGWLRGRRLDCKWSTSDRRFHDLEKMAVP
jgi:hypothetical protein